MIAPVRASQSPNGQQQTPPNEQEQQRFLKMLPAIQREARFAFHWQRTEQREEMIAEAVATAYCLFVRLVQRGKTDCAFATPLAAIAIRRVRAGRQVARRASSGDVMSQQTQSAHGLVVDRLNSFDDEQGEWCTMLVEDRRATPADTAAARIDIATWLGLQSPRNQQVAVELAMGETAREVARRANLSAGRITQIRQSLEASWEGFQAETARRPNTTISA